MREYEVMYTDINPVQIRKKLKAIGAKKKYKRIFKWTNFDFPDWRLHKDHSWIRLRNEGDKVTLTYKQRLGPGKGGNGNDKGMKEISFAIDDFDMACHFFKAIGMTVKYEVEKEREHWVLNDLEFDIDKYPLIQPLLEIESTSMAKVGKGIKLLGLDPEKKKIQTAYQIYLDNGTDIEKFITIHFDKQKKRRVNEMPAS